MGEYVSAGGELDAGDALRAEGVAMRDAMLADLCGQSGIEASLLEPAPGESVREALRRLQTQCDRVWVVAPESAGVLLALSELVEPRRWMGCTPAAIALASSKGATLEHLAAHGLATPRSLHGAARRWVVKPDDGAGACGARVHASAAAAAADAAARSERVVIEPWVEGEALSLSLLCGAAGSELIAINRQRIRIAPDGALHFDGVEPAAIALHDLRATALRHFAEAVVRSLPGLRGFVGIDLVWHDGAGPVAIEINPRLTSAYVGLSARLARPLGAEILGLFRPSSPSREAHDAER